MIDIKKKKMAWYWELLILLILLIVYLATRESEKVDMQRIESNSGYSEGIIIKYEPFKSAVLGHGASPASVIFDYKIDSTTYSNRVEQGYGFNYEIPEGITKGSKYIVIYEKGKPKESYILFDYPIRKQGDFKHYLEEFKANPPKITK